MHPLVLIVGRISPEAKGVRGEPIFSASLPLFDHFDGYVEAVVTASRAAACQALLITKQNPGQMMGGL